MTLCTSALGLSSGDLEMLMLVGLLRLWGGGHSCITFMTPSGHAIH
jgi:hypothetical protein